MWKQRSNISFTNYALKYIENPLFMVVTGSRMYGFADEDSDWDVYAMFAQPGISLLGLYEPEQEFTTPERMLYNKMVSVKVEEAEHAFRSVINGDMKTIERVFSPEVTMRTDHLNEIRKLMKGLVTQQTLRHYLFQVQDHLQPYEENHNIKHLLYALRLSMTLHLLVHTKVLYLKVEELLKLLPDTSLSALVQSKIDETPFTDFDRVKREVAKLTGEAQVRFSRFPDSPIPAQVDRVHTYLTNLRLQFMFSRKDAIIHT